MLYTYGRYIIITYFNRVLSSVKNSLKPAWGTTYMYMIETHMYMHNKGAASNFPFNTNERTHTRQADNII